MPNVIKNPVKVIRAHCIDCSGGSSNEADNCPCENCNLWPWRKGKNPYREKRVLTEEQLIAARERIAKMNATRKSSNSESSTIN